MSTLNKLGLNPKDWKHIKSDDKSTTLQHKAGHLTTIAHNALPKNMQEQLKALSKIAPQDQTTNQKQEADSSYGKVTVKEASGGAVKKMSNGGYAEDENSPDIGHDRTKPRTPASTTDPDAEVNPAPSQAWENLKKGVSELFGKAEGGMVKMASGGAVDQDMDDITSFDPAKGVPDSTNGTGIDPETQKKREMYNTIATAQSGGADPSAFLFGDKGEAPKTFDSKLWNNTEEDYNKQKADELAAKSQSYNSTVQDNSARRAAGLPEVPELPLMASPVSTEAAPPTQQSDNNQQDVSNPLTAGLNDTAGLLQSGYQNQMAGIGAQAQAQGALGQQQAQVLQQQVQAQQQAKQAFTDQYSQLEQERQNHIADIQNGYIDPEKYWLGDANGNGGHSKIATGIGMILAGFNPTSNPNAAVNFLKFQMEQNLEAQKQNLGAKNNLLQANLQQFHNLRDATDMTRLMQADIVQNQLAKASAMAQSPLAKAAALKDQGKLQIDYAPLQQQVAMRRAMMSLAGGPNGDNPNAVDQMLGYMRVQNPEMAKEMESRYVPGVGLGSTPIPQEARQQIISTKSVNDLMNKSLQFSQAHHGTLNPSDLAQASTIQNQLVGAIKQAQHDGVYKPSEAEFLTNQIGGSPASFFANISSVPKIKELQSIKQQEYNNLLSTYGLKQQQLPQTQSPQYKTVNGVKYMRGPNGQAIPVK